MSRRNGRPIPEGWALTRDGTPELDPAAALRDALLVPLGGHKGYGLATMVEVLSTVLTGAALTPSGRGGEGLLDVGHCVMALDPALLRGDGFEDDLDRTIDALRATRPADPTRPVMVAGDPEYACEDDRRANGIPATEQSVAQMRGVAERCGAPFQIAEGRGRH